MGKPQFENQTNITAMSSRSIKKYTKDVTGTGLAQNVVERHTFFSSPNTVSKIINAQMVWNPIETGSLAGTRSLILDNYIDASTGIGIFKGSVADLYSVFCLDQGSFTLGYQESGSITIIPSDKAAFNANLRSMIYDEVVGITFCFTHTAPTTTTATRKIVFFVEEEVVKR